MSLFAATSPVRSAAESPAAAVPPINVSGSWKGVTVNAGDGFHNRFRTVLSLRQAGVDFEGTIKFSELTDGTYGEFRVRGRVDRRSVTFQSISQISSDQRWCLPAGAFQ